MSAVGVFGGTFDPVHYGHLRSALEVSERFELEDFRLLPAGTPPHRPPTVADAGHRLAMLELGASAYPGFRVDEREIRREGYSYMVDTLAEIRREEGEIPLLLVIGQDAANALDGWHQWRRLFELAHLVVMRRPDSTVSYPATVLEAMKGRYAEQPLQLMETSAGLVHHLEITQLDISSTAIRQMLLAGRSPAFLMPKSVIDYIRRHGLYQG